MIGDGHNLHESSYAQVGEEPDGVAAADAKARAYEDGIRAGRWAAFRDAVELLRQAGWEQQADRLHGLLEAEGWL